MSTLAQNGKIWNPNLGNIKKKIAPKTIVYLLLAVVFAIPSILDTFGLISFGVSKHVYHVVNHQLIQTTSSSNWLITIGFFLPALISVFFVNVAFKNQIHDMGLIVISTLVLMTLIMAPAFAHLNRSTTNDSAAMSLWAQKETNSSVEISGLSFTNSKIITTEKGKSYLLSSTGDDKKRTFTLKEIETKG